MRNHGRRHYSHEEQQHTSRARAVVNMQLNTEELEAADPLYCCPVDGDGGVSYSLSLPVVHNQLLGFAEVLMEVGVLAPRCQGSDLSVRPLVFVGDQANVISKLEDCVGAVCGHTVRNEQGAEKRAEHGALGCASVESQGG